MPSMHCSSELVSPRQTPATEEAAEPLEPPALATEGRASYAAVSARKRSPSPPVTTRHHAL